MDNHEPRKSTAHHDDHLFQISRYRTKLCYESETILLEQRERERERER